MGTDQHDLAAELRIVPLDQPAHVERMNPPRTTFSGERLDAAPEKQFDPLLRGQKVTQVVRRKGIPLRSGFPPGHRLTGQHTDVAPEIGVEPAQGLCRTEQRAQQQEERYKQ